MIFLNGPLPASLLFYYRLFLHWEMVASVTQIWIFVAVGESTDQKTTIAALHDFHYSLNILNSILHNFNYWPMLNHIIGPRLTGLSVNDFGHACIEAAAKFPRMKDCRETSLKQFSRENCKLKEPAENFRQPLCLVCLCATFYERTFKIWSRLFPL